MRHNSQHDNIYNKNARCKYEQGYYGYLQQNAEMQAIYKFLNSLKLQLNFALKISKYMTIETLVFTNLINSQVNTLNAKTILYRKRDFI